MISRKCGEIEMKVGVPKEIKNHEYRVGLVPASVRELTCARPRSVRPGNGGARNRAG